MASQSFPNEMLNAFVDGALPPDQTADLLAAMARDPSLARHVAMLQRLKTALATLDDAMDPPPLPAPPARKPARMRHALAAAALLALVAGLAWHSQPRMPASPDTAPTTTALAAHHAWAGTPAPNTPTPMPAAFDWLTPVMQATGLQLAHAQQGPSGLHLGFIGANACRLSLFIQPQDQPDTALDIQLDQHLQQAGWTTSGLQFRIVALDMDLSRFATIATTAHTKSRDHLPASAAQIALINAARLPCLA
ncbi:anti-sigma factor family protein [Roseinatronobacter sp. NSM]|uniref:anti-sigma factor family protein n=1 Tax=Roseinatronobacter sp. NSM TaxID=3457785 RepID=UPI004036F5DE